MCAHKLISSALCFFQNASALSSILEISESLNPDHSACEKVLQPIVIRSLVMVTAHGLLCRWSDPPMLVGSVIPVRSHPLRSSDPPMLAGSVIPVRSHPLRWSDPPMLVGSVIPVRSHPLRWTDPPMLVGSVIPFRSHPLRSSHPPTLVGSVIPVRSHPLRSSHPPSYASIIFCAVSIFTPVVEDFASGIAFASSARKQRLGCADWPARGFCWPPRCVATTPPMVWYSLTVA
jgi:hypothetical protein